MAKLNKKPGPKGRWSKLRNTIISLIKEGKEYNKIRQELEISNSYIYRIVQEENLTPEFRKRVKYKIDQNYFNIINNEDKAYFLGLMYADGYVSRKSGDYHFAISLKYPDKHILEKFSEVLKYTGNLKSYINNAGNKMYCLKVFSKKISEDLEKLGCFQCKSETIRFPSTEQVPDHLIHHFIRGYFDGDGSIFCYENKQRKPKKWCVTIVSNKNFIEDLITKFLEPNLIKSHWIFKPNKCYKNLCIAGNIQIKEFFNEIYKNSTIYFERKYNKFQQFLNEHDETLNNLKNNRINRKREKGKFI